MSSLEVLRDTFNILLQNVAEKWEQVTGRPGSWNYTAPETSSTRSLVMAMQALENRIRLLEDEDTDVCGNCGESLRECEACGAR